MRRLSFPEILSWRATQPLKILLVDPCGLMSMMFIGGNKCDVGTWSGVGGAEVRVRLVVSLTDMPEFEVRTASAGGTAGT